MLNKDIDITECNVNKDIDINECNVNLSKTLISEYNFFYSCVYNVLYNWLKSFQTLPCFSCLKS